MNRRCHLLMAAAGVVVVAGVAWVHPAVSGSVALLILVGLWWAVRG